MMKRALTIFLLFLSSLPLFANQDSIIIHSLIEQSKSYEDLDSSKLYITEALEYAQKQKYTNGLLDAAIQLASLYTRTGEINKAVDLYHTILQDNRNNLNNEQLSSIYNYIGIFHVYMGHYDSTEFYFKRTLEIREESNDSIGIATSLNNLGNVMMTRGKYEDATKHYLGALKIREEINDSNGIASTTNNLGLLFYKRSIFGEAIPYYIKALEINKSQGDIEKEALILINLGNIYDEIRQLDSAVHYYSLAINRAEQIDNARTRAMAYGNMGVAQFNLKDYNSSKNYLFKALKIRIEGNDLEGQAIIYNDLGNIYDATNKEDSAIYFFKKSLEFSEAIDYKECSRDSYHGLASIYEKQGKYEEAYILQLLYQETKDSLINEEKDERISSLNAQYEDERKERKIAEQEALLVKQQLKVQQRNYMLFALALIVILILTSGAFIYHYHKQKQLKLEQELLLKDKRAKEDLQSKLHLERLKISNNLNESIGSQLSYIISSIDNIKLGFQQLDEALNNRLSKIHEFTTSTISQLRDTVWALNKEELLLSDLNERLKAYFNKARASQSNINFEIVLETSSKLKVSSIQAINLYRIIQEAINNSIKYAAASNIFLLINESKEQIEFIVKDDGIGFKMEEITLGEGLENMKNRATTINANFSIVSNPNDGTTITSTIDKRELQG